MHSSYDEDIGYPTTQTSRNIIRFLLSHLRSHDVTPEQWTIIRFLSLHDGMTQKELTLRSDKDKATVTRILNILDRKKLITKKSNGEDRRSVFIFLTDEGKQLMEELRPYIERLFEQKVLKGISSEDLEIYKKVLQQINENIASELDKCTDYDM